MSLRLEMLQVARLAPKLLGESAHLVRRFLIRQQNEDGGFKDRTGRSDLYYTVFGLDALAALEVQSPKPDASSPDTLERLARTSAYLQGFGDGENLDFVHLCCLARAWSATTAGMAGLPELCRAPKEILRRIESFRSDDGGYHLALGSDVGTAYGCFLALGAYQDLKAKLPEPILLAQCLRSLETPDGAWINERHPQQAIGHLPSAIGSTNATAAAVTLLRQFNLPVSRAAADWLLARCHPQGGFLAAPQAPIPDLLSTATALHALAGMEVDFAPIKESCLDFVDSLWTNEGGFHGNWSDDALDCEYTFYGLLALGHLSL
ncbi:MAG: hypothetical protein HY735_16235 [Verrucomicrobia bacterium]|nr:hypothetical protein [Verrucomicrobiota bacterium]